MAPRATAFFKGTALRNAAIKVAKKQGSFVCKAASAEVCVWFDCRSWV